MTSVEPTVNSRLPYPLPPIQSIRQSSAVITGPVRKALHHLPASLIHDKSILRLSSHSPPKPFIYRIGHVPSSQQCAILVVKHRATHDHRLVTRRAPTGHSFKRCEPCHEPVMDLSAFEGRDYAVPWRPLIPPHGRAAFSIDVQHDAAVFRNLDIQAHACTTVSCADMPYGFFVRRS